MNDPLEGGPVPTPFSIEVLPPNLRKHVDPSSPKPLRGMAAKTLVPMGPSQMCTTLFLLTFDPDAEIAAQARASAAALPDRILAVALRDTSLEPPTLDFLSQVLADKEPYLEFISFNTSATDETVSQIASHASAKLADILSQNQLRLLRHEPFLRALLSNPHASKATLDSISDFAVRSGVNLPDVPALVEARLRIFGPELTAPEVPTAAEVADQFEVKDDGQPPMEEKKKQTFTQKVLTMTVSEKIKLAMLGNKEARTLLLRDSNKLVAMAAIQSPRITEGEVSLVANSKTANEDVLRYVYTSREWLKCYPIKLALTKNPKVPLGIAMKFMGTLMEVDVRELSRSKNVPGTIVNTARQMLAKRESKNKS
jgi:hypothetical protein